jgi:hypothetical protein
VIVSERSVDVRRMRRRVRRAEPSAALAAIGDVARATPALRGVVGVEPFDLAVLNRAVVDLEHAARVLGRGRAARQRRYLLASGALDVIRVLVQQTGGTT